MTEKLRYPAYSDWPSSPNGRERDGTARFSEYGAAIMRFSRKPGQAILIGPDIEVKVFDYSEENNRPMVHLEIVAPGHTLQLKEATSKLLNWRGFRIYSLYVGQAIIIDGSMLVTYVGRRQGHRKIGVVAPEMRIDLKERRVSS